LNLQDARMRGLRLALLYAVVPLGLSGCLHKKAKPVVLPQAQAPIAWLPASSDDLPLVETPEIEVPPVPIAAAASRPRVRRRVPPKAGAATAPAANTPPAQVTTAEGATEESAIGELTAGGDASPQRRQEAADLIASNDRRLKALPAKTVSAQRSQISKIRNFQRQAQQALDSGDAEGAKTLATKARLLLYDLDRGGSN